MSNQGPEPTFGTQQPAPTYPQPTSVYPPAAGPAQPQAYPGAQPGYPGQYPGQPQQPVFVVAQPTKRKPGAIIALVTALIVGAAVIFALGQNSAAHTAAQQATTVTSAGTVADASSPDDQFISMITKGTGLTVPAGERDALITLGHTTCRTIDSGVTKDQMILALIQSGVDTKTDTGMRAMGAMVAATQVYCPEHMGFFGN